MNEKEVPSHVVVTADHHRASRHQAGGVWPLVIVQCQRKRTTCWEFSPDRVGSYMQCSGGMRPSVAAPRQACGRRGGAGRSAKLHGPRQNPDLKLETNSDSS